MELFIPVIAGTTRPDRESINVARLVQGALANREGVTTELVDPQDYDLSKDGNDPENKIDRYTDIVRRADGFFIVTPEYNHSFPGSLKSLLDKELEHYMHKPVAFAGASAGRFGGARAIESLVPVVRELGLVASSFDVSVPNVQDQFDEKGNLLNEKLSRSAEKAIDELLWLARVLQSARLAEDSEKS